MRSPRTGVPPPERRRPARRRLAALAFLPLLAIPSAATVAEAPGCPGLAPVGETASQDGLQAWFAEPREGYGHGVFGSGREPGTLVLRPAAGSEGPACIAVVLPEDRVFEDRVPRFVDADGDGAAELLVVEAQLQDGARLAVYERGPDGPLRAAESPPLGRHRWLSPLGVVPWDSGGGPLLAAVTAPHIGGVLRLYRYRPGMAALQEVAQLPGWSTHRFGERGASTALLERDGRGGTWIVLPDRERRRLARLRLRDGEWQVQALGTLPHEVAGQIAVSGDGAGYVVPTLSGSVRLPRPPFPETQP